jgi:hypothetical protein
MKLRRASPYPLEVQANERSESEGEVVRERRETDKFTAVKVPRQCTFVLLVKVD